MSISSLAPRPADPLLSIIGAFKADPSPRKIDLGVGIYQDESGRTPIMAAIQEAHRRFSAAEDSKAYLGPLGWPGMADRGKELVLGEALAGELGGRIRVTPTPGGCGALRLASEIVKRSDEDAVLWMSDPTWANHAPIFTAAGLTLKTYPYYRRGAPDIEREGMREVLAGAKAGDFLLLHGCCHNPTGADLAAEDWTYVAELAAERGITPLIDVAYHGLGTGLDEDVAGVREVLAAAPEALLCYSFSKNMGLYRDRVGFVAVLGETAEAAGAIHTHILDAARRNYSMPPTYGEALAFFTLDDPGLRAQWLDELNEMRDRVNGLRDAACVAFAERFGDGRFDYIRDQNGMFSMLRLSPEQVLALRERHSVYVAPDGRINVCGLRLDKLEHLANCLADVAS